MTYELKRIIIAAALAAAAFNAAAQSHRPTPPARPFAQMADADRFAGLALPTRPSRIRIERCDGDATSERARRLVPVSRNGERGRQADDRPRA